MVSVGEQQLHLGGPRARAVLAALLLEANRPVPISHLVEAVWERVPPATAEHQIRKIVADLRSRIPDAQEILLTDGPGYRIVVGAGQLDLIRFDQALDEARRCATVDGEVAALETALGLYRGQVLPDSRSPVLTAAAAALEDRCLGARERLLELRLEQGRAHDAVSELLPLVAEHPLRESLSALLMVALYRVGRQADALRVYHDLRHLLAEQLGIDPSGAVNHRYQQILRNEPGLDRPAATRHDRPAAAQPPPRPPRSLPHDLPDFTGREAELSRLLSHVPAHPAHPAHPADAHQAVRIITIDGMAGIGKTTLAVHAAHRVADRYPDGQVFLDLHGFSPHSAPVEPHDALGTLLRAVGVPDDRIPGDPPDRESLWRGLTADRRMLLLFDNAVASDQVGPLIPAGPGCLVLVTSRPRLAQLDGATPLPLPLPTATDGLAFLRNVLGHRRVAAEEEAAAELVALCGRLPLALRIVASRLTNRPQWTLAYLAGRLRDDTARLDELVVEHRSVRAALDLSYTAVPHRHQELFRLLGAHPGTDFDGHTVAALAGVSPQTAEALLEDLLDARLVVQHTPGRYTFHSLVRALAREAAAHGPHTAREAGHRLLDYYLTVADQAADLVRPRRGRLRPAPLRHTPRVTPPLRDAADALAWFETERANLLASLAHAEAAGFDSYVARLPSAFAHYLHARGHIEDELGVLRKAVAAARRLGDPALESAALTDMAAPYGHLGRVEEGLECAQEALSLAERAGDRVGAAFCLGRIGMFHNALGRHENAIAALHRALVLLSRADAHAEESAVLTSLGEAQSALGRHAEALQTSRLVILHSRETGDTYGEITGLMGAATAYAGAGQLDMALDRLADASELARRTATPDGQAPILAQYADIYRRQGRHREALHAGHAALQLLRRVRRPALAAAVHNVIGAVHRDRGEYQRAEGHHRKAHRLAQQAGLRRELALALDGIAHARAHSEGPHEAKEHEPRRAAPAPPAPGPASYRARACATAHPTD
ncbi:BTAD domain-containing putative transcriptional regulator [Streptomyces sp. TRM49041]|uniref:AfsR/SARP family transcriptional regulator n=1 Tax=Streptomyces sp. TRM49041 TaxID=2603216 RepID=UPI0016568598|nr:BTAD domain-containing putative transcriptional regulator [Streptomyces sp. TRM49041]